MRRHLLRFVASAALLIGTYPEPLYAQAIPAAAPSSGQASADNQAAPETFNTEQLDSLLAPIALYPDTLLTMTLMATTSPLDIVAASRWLAQDDHKSLTGTKLEDALKGQNWDPSVKSLVPFPQVLETLNQQLEWTQQLGYAMQTQQSDVFSAVQRLRIQAQQAGHLQSNAQLTVRTEPAPPPPAGAPPPPPDAPSQIVVIEPAQPSVVYVPTYNPAVVYGAWPYPATPPVYYPPPPGYVVGTALAAGLVFGAGVAITAGLWGWAHPNWGCCWGGGYGAWGGHTNINVNVNRYNNINVNRHWNGGANGAWRPNNPNFRPGGGYHRPGGPVGPPSRPGGLPANAIGRPGVKVPGNVVRPPSGIGPGNRPGLPHSGIGGGNRPGTGAGSRPGTPPGGGYRPGAGQPGGGFGNRPAGGQPGLTPGNRPGAGSGMRPGAGGVGGFGGGSAGQRQPGAFGNRSDGRSAQQFGNRGAQSRGGGMAFGGGGARHGGGRRR